MNLFQVKDAKLSPLKRVAPKLEREIQKLLEANLETVFGIRFLASECVFHANRSAAPQSCRSLIPLHADQFRSEATLSVSF